MVAEMLREAATSQGGAAEARQINVQPQEDKRKEREDQKSAWLKAKGAAFEQMLGSVSEAHRALLAENEELRLKLEVIKRRKSGALKSDPLVVEDCDAVEEGLPQMPMVLPGQSEQDEPMNPLSAKGRTSATVFELSPIWTDSKLDDKKAVGQWTEQETHSAACLKAKQCYNRCMKAITAHPNSKIRLAWDLFGGVLILYDLIALPLAVFEPPEVLFTQVMDWMCMVFWTLNIFAMLTVGYRQSNGVVVMTPASILVHYLRTWAIVDLILVVPDWIYTVAIQSDAGSSSNVLRIARLFRTLRFLRLLKLKWIIDAINDLLDSEVTAIFVNVVKMVLLLLAINHLIACIWYSIALLSGEGGQPNWLHHHGFDRATWSYKYLVAFHWSLTRFAPASMQVQPQNEWERTFAIFIVVFALVGFSCFVGSITASLLQLRSMSAEADGKIWQLRHFLRRSAVPIALSLRIQRFVQHADKKQGQQMPIQKVEVLSLLSGQLARELNCALNLPHMSLHPLFKFLNEVSSITMQWIAATAVERMIMARGDMLFLPGEKGTHMHFVTSGRLLYTKADDTHKQEWVERGEDWIAEPVLWTSGWFHLGQLVATADCELVKVDPTAFAAVAGTSKSLKMLTALYAKGFLDWLSKQGDDLSDIVQGDVMGVIVEDFLPPLGEARTVLGHAGKPRGDP